jgi:hypothetical protein
MLDGGHRIATVLMYLSTVKMGGEIIFPNSEVTYLLTLVLALVISRDTSAMTYMVFHTGPADTAGIPYMV